jgi:TonB family protein
MIKRFILFQLIFSFFFLIQSSAQISESSDEPTIILDDSTVTQSDSELFIDTEAVAAALEKDPELTTFVKANYPDNLIASGIEGTVTFELLINETGKVDSVKIIKSLHPVLDSSAMKAVSKFIFSPGIADGKPVPVSLIYDYRFTLDKVVTGIQEFTNIKGIILEKGTRAPLVDAIISVSVGDTNLNVNDSSQIVATKSGKIPLKRYLEKIGSFPGQSLEGRNIITSTDSTGTFSLKSIPSGLAYIKIIATGYEPHYSEIEVNDSEEIKLTIRMDRMAIDEYEITVYGKAEQKETIQRTLQAREAKRVPGFSGDAVKAVQALPGVARPIFGSTEIILRGADWNDNKYYLDGVEVPYLWHDVGNNSVINSNMIDKVELFPSGFGVKYGDALGGVINVDTRKAKDKMHLIADMNLSYSSLVLDVPITKNLSFTGSVRREYYMSLMLWLLKKFDFDLNMNMYYWDYSLRMDYTPTKDHNIFCEFMQAKDILEITMLGESEGENSIDYKKGFKLGVAGWDWTISNSWVNKLRYGLAPLSTGVDMGMDKSLMNFKLSGYEHTVRDELQWKINEKFRYSAGLDLHLEPTDFKYHYKGNYNTAKDLTVRDTTVESTTDFLNGSVGGYLSMQFKPIDNLTINPEYRLDYYPGLNYHGSLLPEFWNYESKPTFRWSYEPSFRLSSRYKVTDKHTIKGSAGTYNQSPSYDAMDEPWGNPLLEPARGSQYTLGYEWQITDLISLDISGYINQQWDKSNWMDAFERGDQYDEGILVNRGKGRMRGVELFLRHNQGNRFSGWLSYSLSYSERYNFKEKKWIVFDRNILNNLQLVSSLNLKKNMNIGLRFQYTDGYPFTPAEGVLYYDAANGYYAPKWGETNSKKYTPYLELDFRFEKKLAFYHSILTLYVGCDRIFHFLQLILKDNGEPFYLPAEIPTYNYDYSKFEGFANFPAITFGLSVEF